MIKLTTKKLKTIKQSLEKKVGLALLLTSVSLFCSQSQAAILLMANFDTGVDVEISSSVAENEFRTNLYDELVFVEGNASGGNSGSNDSGFIMLGADETGTMSAAADGQIDGIGGFVQSSWETGGFFHFQNNTGADVSVDVVFDITWFANIFTANADEEAYATAGVFIEDSLGDRVFADWIELDSLIQGPGAFSASDSFAVNFNFILADGDFEAYSIVVDSFGFAENFQEIPEPVGLLSSGMVLMFALRRYRVRVIQEK